MVKKGKVLNKIDYWFLENRKIMKGKRFLADASQKYIKMRKLYKNKKNTSNKKHIKREKYIKMYKNKKIMKTL